MVTIIGQRATKIEVINNLTEAKAINIDIIHEFRVNYAEDNEHCRGILSAGFQMQGQPEILTIRCTVVGEFATDRISSDEDKKKCHMECYLKLFPYAQALIMRLCTDAGLPPFFFQPVETTEENISFAD